MARKVRCKICKNHGDTESFYKVSISDGKNGYYCSKEEYENYQDNIRKQKELKEYVASEILNYDEGQIVPPIMVKKLHDLNKFYDWEVIHETFKVSKENINYWNSVKNFESEFGKISYIMKIIEGNINDVYKSWKYKKQQKLKQENNLVDLEMMNQLDNHNTRKKNDNGILAFLDEEDI